MFNGEWFEMMHYEQVIRLNSRVTLQQIMQREDFKTRFQAGTPVSLHELQYPLLQGWDSVMVQADVEIGGTDQLFNILVARDLQKEEGMPPQVVMVMPILEGLDGVQKMSKSLGNYIGVAEPPVEMFGKTMSISDELMARYYPLLLGEDFPPETHPMEAKKSARRAARGAVSLGSGGAGGAGGFRATLQQARQRERRSARGEVGGSEPGHRFGGGRAPTSRLSS